MDKSMGSCNDCNKYMCSTLKSMLKCGYDIFYFTSCLHSCFEPRKQEEKKKTWLKMDNLMGSCIDCKHIRKQNDFEFECCKQDGTIAYLHTFFRKQKHSCFEPRKEDEKKTTWYLFTFLHNGYVNQKLDTNINGFKESDGWSLLSTKQIETSETDIKKIWEELNELQS